MPEQSAPTPPKVFISYAWSSPTHESWVLTLASRLREDGADAILDKWDLKPGHDANLFMEQMVTDPGVTKVIMICDKTYTEKANKRAGGVGTESQIISPELYGKGTQDKYAALITDEDGDGQAHVPVFYKGRIFFDFRSADRFENSYEQLLRWLLDRPQHVKPKLGSAPAAILHTAPVATATQSRARRAEDAIRQGSPAAPGLVREYADALLAELQALSPDLTGTEPADDVIIATVAAMRPYIRQFNDLVATAARFGQDARAWDGVLSLHERLGKLMYRPPEVMRWNTLQADPYKILVHETFLSTLGSALSEERFDLAEAMIRRPYLVRDSDGANRRSTSDFSIFYQFPRSLEARNDRLKLRRLSVQADLLAEAHPLGSVPSLEALMQADLVLFLCAGRDNSSFGWYPLSLLYAYDRFSPFPLFARAESLAYFGRLQPLLGVASIEAFKVRVQELEKAAGRMFQHQGFPLRYLANVEHIGSIS